MMVSHQNSGRPVSNWLLTAAVLSLFPVMTMAGSAPGVYRFEDEPVLLADAMAFSPWADMIERREPERELVSECLANRKACPYYLKGYSLIVRRARSIDRYGQLHLVNRFVNKRRWVSDDFRTADHSEDIWLTPVRFLRDGGDCEDFAVAKYFMLRDLGFDVADLRVVVASDHEAKEPHAVVAVRIAGKVLLMETDDSIRRAREHHKYGFLYSVNEHFFFDHAGVARESLAAAADK